MWKGESRYQQKVKQWRLFTKLGRWNLDVGKIGDKQSKSGQSAAGYSWNVNKKSNKKWNSDGYYKVRKMEFGCWDLNKTFGKIGDNVRVAKTLLA